VPGMTALRHRSHVAPAVASLNPLALQGNEAELDSLVERARNVTQQCLRMIFVVAAATRIGAGVLEVRDDRGRGANPIGEFRCGQLRRGAQFVHRAGDPGAGRSLFKLGSAGWWGLGDDGAFGTNLDRRGTQRGRRQPTRVRLATAAGRCAGLAISSGVALHRAATRRTTAERIARPCGDSGGSVQVPPCRCWQALHRLQRYAARRLVDPARCRTRSCLLAPILKRARTRRSMLTDGSPASIFATRD